MESEITIAAGDPAAATLYSHYVRRLLDRHPQWAVALRAELASSFTRAEMERSVAGEFADKDALHAALRILRQRVMLRVIARDLAGLATLDEVVSTVTALAEVAIATALSHHTGWLTRAFGDPRSPGGERQMLIVV
ncbi:MAG: bifunctional glutamine synthetase adenylyltransferase/deadenyltransferase, partial [Betaproteobacteria bacterium]